MLVLGRRNETSNTIDSRQEGGKSQFDLLRLATKVMKMCSSRRWGCFVFEKTGYFK